MDNSMEFRQGSRHLRRAASSRRSVHASHFKAKRNRLYTAVTRAKKVVKISGIGTKLELRKKIELHPKTVLWQHERCGQGFPAERLAAAHRDAARMQ